MSYVFLNYPTHFPKNYQTNNELHQQNGYIINQDREIADSRCRNDSISDVFARRASISNNQISNLKKNPVNQ